MKQNKPVIEAQNLRRHYKNVLAVNDFTLTVNEGEILVLVGPNGCGKTTSIEMMLGFRKTESGQSRILGLNPLSQRRELARLVGVQLQGASLHSKVKIREQLRFIGVAFGTEDQAFELAKELDLSDHLNALCGSLSGGMQRRVLVLNALAGFPRLAVLDEPTSGVDPESRLKLWSVILKLSRDYGITMLITSHDLIEAERYGDRVVMMRAGNIIANDTPSVLIAKTGFTRVVSVKGDNGCEVTSYAKRYDGAVLINASNEIAFGFKDRGQSKKFLASLQAKGKHQSVTEREMSLEDTYFYRTSFEGKNDKS